MADDITTITARSQQDAGETTPLVYLVIYAEIHPSTVTFRSDLENEFNTSYGGAVQKRISQLKIADTSRLSTLSSSTPELSAVKYVQVLILSCYAVMDFV